MRRGSLRAVSALLLCCTILSAGVAAAQERKPYQIPAQALDAALLSFGRQAGLSVAPDSQLFAGRTSPALQGNFSDQEALERLLAGSGIQPVIDRETRSVKFVQQRSALPKAPALAMQAAPAPARLTPPEIPPEELTVTGSRIRGAPIASAVIARSQKQILDAGQSTLAEMLRTIPQNFTGGQNPGVGVGAPTAAGINVASASSINLRGLGPDATLSLLNGHRLIYNASRQAVDISTIPLAAIDRVEIVADGASAMYGSDAVAGVANILLKRDYDGVSTTARVATSTDGGNFQREFSVVGGTVWATGGVMAVFDTERDTRIKASQRSYTASRNDLTLYPALDHNNMVLTGHQELASNLEFSFDAIYNKRWSASNYSLAVVPDFHNNGIASFSDSELWAVSPSLTLALPHDWRMSLNGSYGQDFARFSQYTYTNGVKTGWGAGCYCNKSKSAELNADGAVLQLPAGDLKLAVGGGYRSNDLNRVQAGVGFQVSQSAYYAYGEASIPLIGAAQRIPFVDNLNFSAAVRYEDYRGGESVATPKLGVIYAPTPDFDVKGSWGKSFKAPTLYQQYSLQSVTAYPATSAGITGQPSTATVLYRNGGNPDLKSEHATTWSATLNLHPRSLNGARFEISYFNVDFSDRVVTPVPSLSQASNPLYRNQLILNPSAALQQQVLAGAIFNNAGGANYVPGTAYALVNNLNINAAVQRVNGVDVSAAYPLDLPDGSALTLQGNASYLRSVQQLSAAQPETTLAGLLYYPPHWRGRGGAVWEKGPVTLSSFVTYIGGLDDKRTGSTIRVGGMTTVDVTGRYQADLGPVRDVEFLLTVQNLFNDKPSVVSTTLAYDAPFDTVNYSPVGRFIGLSVTKKW